MMAASFAGCQKPALDEPVEVNDTFTASIEEYGSQTKTSMNSEKQTLWSVGDRVAIFRGKTTACEYKLTDESADSQSGTFKWVSGDKTTGADVPCNVAYYPYADGLALSAELEISNVVLPEVQTYAENSFANGAFPMVAVTSSVNSRALMFKNVAGAMNLQFKGTQKILSVKVEGNAGEVLSGAAVVAAGSTPSVQMVATEPSAVVLDCGEGVQLSETEATSFILALPPVQFTEGFTVTVLDADNLVYTIVSNVENEILRSGILVMDELTLDVNDGVPVPEPEPEPVYSNWSLPGGYNGWNTSAFLVDATEYLVAKNVKVMDGTEPGFKFQHADFGWKGVAGTNLSVGEWHKFNGENNITLAGGNVAYDVYMTMDGSQFQAVLAGSPVPELPVVVADYWGLVGSFTDGWAGELVLVAEGEYLVTKGVTISATDEFKFRKNGDWSSDQKIAKGGLAAADIEYDLIDAGNSNMKVSAAGTYDVYVKNDLSKVYFMTAGKTPADATLPDVSNVYRFYVQNNVSWTTLNFYAWGGYASAGWPGDKMTLSATVDGYGECKYIEITKGVSVVNFIINNGSKQTKDLKVSGNSNVKQLNNGDYIYILKSSDVK